jgi:hypothetical protein
LRIIEEMIMCKEMGVDPRRYARRKCPDKF